MTYYSKKAIVSIAGIVLTFIPFYINIMNQIQLFEMESKETLALWGQFFIILLITNVGIKIVSIIIFNIINSIIAKEKEPKIVDERDQIIELKSVRNFCFVFSLGFFLAMAVLMFNGPLTLMFQILAFAFPISGIVLELSYILYYEREA